MLKYYLSGENWEFGKKYITFAVLMKSRSAQ